MLVAERNVITYNVSGFIRVPKVHHTLVSFSVNDTLCGTNTIDDAPNMEQQLFSLLVRGGTLLSKFCADHPTVLKAVPPDFREVEVPIGLDRNECIKTLTPLWNPSSDQFLIIKETCIQNLREPKHSPVIKIII